MIGPSIQLLNFSDHICLYVSNSTPIKEISNDVMVYPMNECGIAHQIDKSKSIGSS